MDKTNLWWNIINSILLIVLTIIFMSQYYSVPILENRVSLLEMEVSNINYFIDHQHDKKDTVVINFYQQQQIKKK